VAMFSLYTSLDGIRTRLRTNPSEYTTITD
jgi:hypothetical protein